MEQAVEQVMKDWGVPIPGFSSYGVLENGTVRNNWSERILKPDKYDAVCIRARGKCKTFQVARLVAICYLGMPDDKDYIAYKKDPNGGFEKDNITWAPKHEALSTIHKRRKKNELNEPEVIE